MRAPLALAIAAVVVLAGCGQQGGVDAPQAGQAAAQAPVGPPPVPANAVAVRGQVSIEGLSELSTRLQAQLRLRLRLLDMSDPSIVPPVVAERIEPAPFRLPHNYALPYGAEAIKPEGRYVVEAALVSGDVVVYGTPLPIAVLTQGAGNQAAIALARGGGLPSPDIAPADLLKQDFDKLERAIGGMKKYTGERIEDKITVGWDAFADSTGIRFARQVVDYDKGGVVSFKFAYKDGQPWVISREKGGVITLVGWGADGTLVLNRDNNDKQLDEAAVAELRALAETVYQDAAAKRG